jgi:hypothetical protein
MLAFAQEPFADALAADAVFVFNERDDESGEVIAHREIAGCEAIMGALGHFYGRGGTLHTPATEVVALEGRAMVEVAFYGRDLGGFFGLATTPEPVVVPCCMVFAADGDRIGSGYLTFDLALLRQRVGAARG